MRARGPSLVVKKAGARLGWTPMSEKEAKTYTGETSGVALDVELGE